MICVVIKGPTFSLAFEQIKEACQHADMVELRLDCFKSVNLLSLKELLVAFTIPMILTLRCPSQGGEYQGTEEDRLKDITSFAALNPDYLDLENHVCPSFIKKISHEYPKIKIILSYHDFTGAPDHLDLLLAEMQKKSAHFYKIAVTARSTLDALKLLCLKTSANTIVISMGFYGKISRILGPIVKNPITYASLEDNQQSAPGQITAQILHDIYHYHSINPRTSIYGLIGDPVTESISAETHNHFFQTNGLNVVYVKMRVKAEELIDFLKFAKKLPIRGLSVTMPLKERIIPYLDEIDDEARTIGAVNTIVFNEGKTIGYNTDGFGALNAIEKQINVKGKHIVILGAGGAAKAIAYEANQRGANVTILNRNKEKAHLLAASLNCRFGGLNEIRDFIEEGYDIIVNCTSHPMPIEPQSIIPGSYVMDITTKPKETEFLKYATKQSCKIIYGYQMFVEQALGQFNLWFKEKINPELARHVLEKKALKSATVHKAEVLPQLYEQLQRLHTLF